MSTKQWWKDWSVQMFMQDGETELPGSMAKVEIKLPNAENSYASVIAPPELATFIQETFTNAFTLIEKLHDENKATTSLMFDVSKWNFKDRVTAAFGMIAGGKFIIDSAEVKIEKELKSATKEGKKYVG